MIQRIKPFYPFLVEGCWALLFIGLPFTSFPILGWMSNSQAAPFSAIPLGLLGIIWFLPQIMKGRLLPKEVLPILVFTIAAVVSSTCVYYLDIVHFEERTFLDQSLRAFLTLFIGLAFYIIISTRDYSEKSFSRVLQWIHIGGMVMLLWGLIQAIIIFNLNGHFPSFLERIRGWLVIQTSAVREGNRLTSLAYEPSWFAHQLNMLYLPIWLASTYLRKSVFKFRFLHLTVENILLAVGLVEFILSRPRVGTAAFLLMLAFLLLLITLSISRKISQKILGQFQIGPAHQKLASNAITLVVGFLMLVIYVGLALSVAYVGSRFDERLGLLFTPLQPAEMQIIRGLNESAMIYVGNRLRFLERVIYWLMGWHVFRDYPILGVGLGNSGFFVLSHISPEGWATTEFRNLIYRFGFMVNTKSYWIRILAETGLVGFSFFLTWLTGLWRSARFLAASKSGIITVAGLAGQFALIAFIVEGFSIDSFALPYLWVMAGLISGMRMHSMQSQA
ncbi:MAG: O-antigen ligase family protein [Anaerolineaceae bacterium]|nr:O-antigen ligase family protein [Anaerolineaceae bacterium]